MKTNKPKSVDFEQLHDQFRKHFKIAGIKHADEMHISSDKIVVIEKSLYVNKLLVNNEVREQEARELIQKMWGSFAILVFHFYNNPLELSRKKKVFVLEAKVERSEFARILDAIVRTLRDHYKNGIFNEVYLKIT